MQSYTLSNGVTIPAVGFGTWKANESDAVQVVADAIASGYRLIDTAAFYGTEEAVGCALRQSGIDRREFFITTKAWKTDMGYDGILRAHEQSLSILGLDYVDLYMIHWPMPEGRHEQWREIDRESWRAMERIYEEGGARAIGMSNFLVPHLENIFSSCTIAPMVEQLEFHPGYIQMSTVRYAREHGMQLEAWSPMGQGRLNEHPVLLELAQAYGVSLQKLCLRFSTQQGIIPLPKSQHPSRQKENLNIFDFDIAPDDMKRILSLPEYGWSGRDPNNF